MVLNVVYVPYMQCTQKLTLSKLVMTENVKISLSCAYLLSSVAFIPSPFFYYVLLKIPLEPLMAGNLDFLPFLFQMLESNYNTCSSVLNSE